jgi:hypothetical protein
MKTIEEIEADAELRILENQQKQVLNSSMKGVVTDEQIYEYTALGVQIEEHKRKNNQP